MSNFHQHFACIDFRGSSPFHLSVLGRQHLNNQSFFLSIITHIFSIFTCLKQVMSVFVFYSLLTIQDLWANPSWKALYNTIRSGVCFPVVPDRQTPSNCPSISPWKSPCTSKLNDSTLGGTFVRWEENTLPWWVPLAQTLLHLSLTVSIRPDGKDWIQYFYWYPSLLHGITILYINYIHDALYLSILYRHFHITFKVFWGI